MKQVIITVLSIAVLAIIGGIFYHILFTNDKATDIQNIQSTVESGEYDYTQGVSDMHNNDYVSAEKHFADVLKLKDKLNKQNLCNTLVNMGVCYDKQGKTDQAKDYWQQAATLGDTTAMENLNALKRQQ